MPSNRFRFFSFYATLLLISCFSFPAFAQQPAGKDINAGVFNVEGVYSPVLADPVKIDFPPVTVKPDTSRPVLKYSVQPKLLNLPFIPADIRPLAMVKEDLPSVQNNYLKLGFGTQFSPLGELYLNTGQTNKYDGGIYAYHLNGTGSPKYQTFADNTLQLNGERYFKTNSLSAILRYDRNSFHYYGYNKGDGTIVPGGDSIKQVFSKIAGELNFGNTKKNKSLFDYNWHFGFYNLTDNYHANETNFNTSLDLEKEYQKIHHFHFKIAVDVNSFSQDIIKYNNTLVHISPWYTIQTEDYKATIGFDVVPNSNSTFFFPKLEGQYNLVDQYFIPFAGITGSVNKNNFLQLTETNPFLNPYQPQTYDKKYNFFLGVKGSAGNHFSYLFKVQENLYDNLPMFWSDTNRIRGFYVQYQNGAGELNVHGEVGYRESEHFNLILGADYFSYQLDFQDTALGYPAGRLSLKADYNIQDKILIGASLFAYSQSFTRVPTRTGYETESIPGYLDLNLSIQYNYKKNFGAFLNINNITSTKYQRWYNYPSYGFNLIAGLLLKF